MSYMNSETPNIDWQIEEMKKRGQDPATSICCAPSAGTKGFVKGIAGCQRYHRCPFGKKQYGAFKHTLPQNVPYFIDTREAGVEGVTEMFMPCFRFVQLLMPRMKAGQDARDEGMDGEIIEVLAENGKLADKVVMTGFVKTSKPGVVPEVYERQDTEVPVAPFKYPSEMSQTVISKVRQRRQERLERDPDNQEQSFEEVEVPTRKPRRSLLKKDEEWNAVTPETT